MFLILLAISLPAESQGLTTPSEGAQVSIATKMTSTEGTFLREEDRDGTVYWVVRTKSGTLSIPKSIILNWAPGLVAVPGAAQASCPAASAPVHFTLHGSNTVGAKLAPALARAYAAKCGRVNEILRPSSVDEESDVEYSGAQGNAPFIFHFHTHGTKTGFESLLANVADIGMASSPLNEDMLSQIHVSQIEKQRFKAELTANEAENVIAMDGILILVNDANTLKALTIDQIARIFAGEINDWSQVGAVAGPIHIYSRDEKSGTYDTFKKLVLDASTPPRRLGNATLFQSNEDLSDAVAADPSGIGFAGFSSKRNARAIAIDTVCGLSFPPAPFGVRSEDYPLSRRLYFYVPQVRRNNYINDFLSFVLSDEAQLTINNSESIGLDIEKASPAYTAERTLLTLTSDIPSTPAAKRVAAGFVRSVNGAVRLSVTFRFEKGSFALDSRAREDLDRLVNYVRSNPGFARRIKVFGFTDKIYDFDYNLKLSKDRANEIAKALSVALRTPIEADGFGKIAPVACGDSEAALQKNRRVEVWLQP